MRILLSIVIVCMFVFFLDEVASAAGTCSPQCVNGTCNDNNECVCNSSNWVGPTCEECSQYYFGPTCSSLCSVCEQHGTCTQGKEGFCTCDDGWHGVQCMSFHCSTPCVHGVCSGPLTCTCSDGWSGPLCEIPVCSPACEHGDCFAPNMCDCEEGWGGSLCNVCDSQHFGSECQYACSECDIHGTCHSGVSGSCSCDSDWTGTLCTVAVCDTPCDPNATCLTPGWCECNDGYVGDGYDCRQITQCTGKFDWTPCILEDEGEAYCFDEICASAASGDSCSSPLSLEIDVGLEAHFDEMHPYSSVPESCAGKFMFDRDIFFRVDIIKEGAYEFSALPGDGIDVGIAVWSECSVDADKCIEGADIASASQAESLVLDLPADSSVVFQVVQTGYSEEHGGSAPSGFSVLVSEYSAPDGDVEPDADSDTVDSGEYEIIFDYDIEMPEFQESSDGDFDGDTADSCECDSEMESELHSEDDSDFDTEPDSIESAFEELADQDDSAADADGNESENDGVLSSASSGSCSGMPDAVPHFLILLLLVGGCMLRSGLHRNG